MLTYVREGPFREFALSEREARHGGGKEQVSDQIKRLVQVFPGQDRCCPACSPPQDAPNRDKDKSGISVAQRV